MDQVALAIEDSIDCIGKISADLAHPPAVGGGRDAGNLHFACRQLDEEQHDEPLQPSSRPHFYGEGICGPQSVPNAGPETPSRSSSGSAPAPARSRAVPECRRLCCGQARAPDWTTRPGCADSPNPGSPLPFEPPKPRSLRRSEVVPVRPCHCRRISRRSVSDARPTRSRA